MSTHDFPHASGPADRAGAAHDPAAHDPAAYDDAALEEEITRGTVHHRDYGLDAGMDGGRDSGRDDQAQPAGVGTHGSTRAGSPAEGPDGIRTGTLVWGVIALLVALWSLSATVLDWNLDPVLVVIALAAVGGLALVAGGIAGATRRKSS